MVPAAVSLDLFPILISLFSLMVVTYVCSARAMALWCLADVLYLHRLIAQVGFCEVLLLVITRHGAYALYIEIQLSIFLVAYVQIAVV